MQNKTFQLISTDFSKIPAENQVYLKGSLTRFVSANFGRVMCSEDYGFFFCDLEVSKISTLQRILEVNGAVVSQTLVTSAALFSLASGEAVA